MDTWFGDYWAVPLRRIRLLKKMGKPPTRCTKVYHRGREYVQTQVGF